MEMTKVNNKKDRKKKENNNGREFRVSLCGINVLTSTMTDNTAVYIDVRAMQSNARMTAARAQHSRSPPTLDEAPTVSTNISSA